MTTTSLKKIIFTSEELEVDRLTRGTPLLYFSLNFRFGTLELIALYLVISIAEIRSGNLNPEKRDLWTKFNVKIHAEIRIEILISIRRHTTKNECAKYHRTNRCSRIMLLKQIIKWSEEDILRTRDRLPNSQTGDKKTHEDQLYAINSRWHEVN